LNNTGGQEENTPLPPALHGTDWFDSIHDCCREHLGSLIRWLFVFMLLTLTVSLVIWSEYHPRNLISFVSYTLSDCLPLLTSSLVLFPQRSTYVVHGVCSIFWSFKVLTVRHNSRFTFFLTLVFFYSVVIKSYPPRYWKSCVTCVREVRLQRR
jgi:hypothetical protein